MNLALAGIVSGGISSLSLLEQPFCNQKLESIFADCLPGDWPIYALDLSTRTENSLIRAGISGLGDLGRLTPTQLRDLRNTGRKSIEEIIDAYISKLNKVVENPKIIINSEKVVEPNKTPQEDLHVSILLGFLIQRIERREATIIRNAISDSRISSAEIASAWGISRQRIHQISKNLLMDAQIQNSLDVLSERALNGYKIQTLSESVSTAKFLMLGRVDEAWSISILDLLLFSRKLVLVTAYLIVDYDFVVLKQIDSISELITKVRQEPELASPDSLSLLDNANYLDALSAESVGNLDESMKKAQKWLDNLH